MYIYVWIKHICMCVSVCVFLYFIPKKVTVAWTYIN